MRPKQPKVSNDISQSLGKLPPQELDIEAAVLGAIILEKKAIIEVASILRVNHFYSEAHQEIYRAIIEMFAAGESIDMLTLVGHIRSNGKLEIIGGAYYIAELTSRVSSAANIEFHARLLVEAGMKRSLIKMASDIHQEAYEDTTDVFSLIEKSNLEIQEIYDDAIGSKAEQSMVEIGLKVIRTIEARQSGKHTGLDSGFAVLDSLLNGFNKTDLIILAARPGMGKTSFAMQAGKNIAEKGIPVGIFSLEMSNEQLVERLAISESEIDSDRVKKGLLDSYEVSRYMDAVGKLSNLPIFIDDTPFMTILELRARAMRMKTKHKIQFIIVDYLQLIKGINEGGKTMNRDQEIGVITRTLKGIAKELDIPIVALAQLSRAVETRGGLKKPQLSDLRESGSIEQDADVVLFLYRPEYYKITEDQDGFPTHGLCEVIAEKHRNGSTGTVKVKFIGKLTKFAPWETEYVPTTKRQEYATSHYKDPTQKLNKDDDEPF